MSHVFLCRLFFNNIYLGENYVNPPPPVKRTFKYASFLNHTQTRFARVLKMSPTKFVLKIVLLFFVFALSEKHTLIAQTQNTWDSLAGPSRTPKSFDITVSKNNIAYTADLLRLMKTTNGGNDWDTTKTPIDSPLVVSSNPDSGNYVLVGKEGKVLFSSVGGGTSNSNLNWINVIPSQPNIYPSRFSRSPSTSSIVWLGSEYTEGNTSLRFSERNGRLGSWVDIKYFKDSVKTNITDIAIRSGNDNEVWVTGTSAGKAKVSGVWRTYNAMSTNSTWKYFKIKPTTENQPRQTSVALLGSKVLVGTENGDIYALDTITNATNPVRIFNFSSSQSILSLRTVGSRVVAAAEQQLFVIRKTTSNWTADTLNKKDNTPGSLNVRGLPKKKTLFYSIAVDPLDTNKWFVSTSRGVYRTTNGGTIWLPSGTYTMTVPAQYVVANESTAFSISKEGKKGKNKYLAGADRYDRSANDWDAVDFGDNSYNFECKGFYFYSPDTVFSFGRLQKDKNIRGQEDTAIIFVSYDRGSTWERNYVGHPSNNAVINGMMSWTNLTTDYNGLIAFGKISKRDTILLIRSSNGGQSWLPFPKKIFDYKGEVVSLAQTPRGLPSMKGYAIVKSPGNDDVYYLNGTSQGPFSWLKLTQPQRNPHRTNNFGTLYNCAMHIVRGTDAIPFIAGKKGLFRSQELILSGECKQVVLLSNRIFIIREGKPDVVYTNRLDVSGYPSEQWSNLTSQFSAEHIYTMSIVPQYIGVLIDINNFTLYCATEKGVFRNNVSLGAPSAGKFQTTTTPPRPKNLVVGEGEEMHCIEDVVIPEGSSFIVQEGGSVVFDEGMKMRIEGALNVYGSDEHPVKFGAAYDNTRWKGIYLAPGASAYIENAEISDAVVGIFAAKADLSLSNVTVRNCRIGAGMYGMNEEPPLIEESKFLTNDWGIVLVNGADATLTNNVIAEGQKGILIDASSPLFSRNEIKNHSQVGVVVYNSGYPRFGEIATNSQGLNIVQGNALTQLLTVQGYAFLGYVRHDCITQVGGENLIAGTDPNAPLCVAVEKSAITSMITDWGLATVSAENFLTDPTSKIIFECLSQEPANEAEKLLWEALERRSLGDYETTKEKLEEATLAGTTEQALRALGELAFTVKLEEDGTGASVAAEENFFDFLSSVAASHPIPEVEYAAAKILALDAAKNEDMFTAYDKMSTLSDLALDDDTKISTLLARLFFETCDLEYDDNALETAITLQTHFPDDERTQLAGIVTEFITDNILPQQYSKRRAFDVAMRKFPARLKSQNVPKTFALYHNYPNPFNPTTMFTYDVPKDAHVEIILYDLLGRKIATLVNEIKPAGYYSVGWNASAVSSDVYFVKMQSENFSKIHKVMVMK